MTTESCAFPYGPFRSERIIASSLLSIWQYLPWFATLFGCVGVLCSTGCSCLYLASAPFCRDVFPFDIHGFFSFPLQPTHEYLLA